MEKIAAAFVEGLKLLVTLDNEVYFIIWTSVRVTFFSVLFASFLGIPMAYWIYFRKPGFKKISTAILNSLMAIPTVVIGLLVFSFISRSSPLGFWGILFTPTAIIIGQTLLALPIIVSLVLNGISQIDQRLSETLLTLGAKGLDFLFGLIHENQYILLSAVMGGFGRIIGEVGVSMVLGGNIRFYTRTMTTAIALETSKGDFSIALALGFVLLILALGVNLTSYLFLKNENVRTDA